jgi:hypothetical protein
MMQKTVKKSNRKIGKAYRKQKIKKLKKASRKILKAQRRK